MNILSLPVNVQMDGRTYKVTKMYRISGQRWVAKAYMEHALLGEREVMSLSILYRLADRIQNPRES